MPGAADLSLCSPVRQAKPDFSNDLKGNHRDNLVSIM